MRGNETRDAIVSAADDLFYRQGFDATGFADIAGAVGISRGNFYYHFRAKDEILDAVIDRRLDATRAMIEGWEAQSDDPAARICCFVRILIANGEKIVAHGCPVGTLCYELAKRDHAELPHATRVFATFREWLARCFTEMGRGKDADELALLVLSFSQGTATLFTALRDQDWVAREVARMCAWVHAQKSQERE